MDLSVIVDCDDANNGQRSLDCRDVPQGKGVVSEILGSVVRDDHLLQQHLWPPCSLHVEDEWWTLWFG